MEKRQVTVKVKNIAQSPQKLRLVVDTVRGGDVEDALATLKFLNKKGARFVLKAIESGVANAMDRFELPVENLKVVEIRVDEAPTRKTGRFASRGRYSRILKRRSHLNLIIAEK